jgi:two-component system sensor histidine kinase/response regulator
VSTMGWLRRADSPARIGWEQEALELAAAGVLLVDAGRIAYANAHAATLLGRTRDELVGAEVASLLPADALARHRAALSRVSQRGGTAYNEYELRRPDGTRVAIAVSSSGITYEGRTAALAVLHDIGERLRADAELKSRRDELESLVHDRTRALSQAELFARTIADNLPGRIVYWDRDMRCLFANRSYCEWFGFKREDIVGRTVDEIFPAARWRPVEPQIQGVLAGEPQFFEREETDLQGKPATTLVQFLPDIAEGQVRGFYVFAMDITERKLASQRLQALNEELVLERDKAQAATRAKSAFLANMSHEIRTPMNAIIGLTHLMQRDTRDALGQDRLGKIADAAHHLMGIINDVLDLSKIDAGKLELEALDFDLDEMLARSCSMVAGSAHAKGLELHVDSSDLPRQVRGDPTRLSQVLMNLLGNAVKFTERGSVSLRGTLLERDASGLHLRFEVRDTGIGIERERIGKLFDAFEQSDSSTTRRFGGTGLGLAVTRQLVDLMGGAVGVESTPGVGSLFWVTVHVQPAAAQSARPARAGQAAAPGTAEMPLARLGARVLLAEDNAINQEVAKELLRVAGYEVDVADNGRRAIEMARTGGYDLILMDVQMPELDGIEASRQIRAMSGLSRIPIIAMTANAFAEDRAACLAAGMNDHVAKPVHAATLYDTLARWLPPGQ